MSNEQNTFFQTSIRLPATTLERAASLLELVRAHPFYGGMGATKRADVLRLALVKGLEVLESELLEAEEANKKK